MSCCRELLIRKAAERQNISSTLSCLRRWWLKDLCTCITVHWRCWTPQQIFNCVQAWGLRHFPSLSVRLMCSKSYFTGFLHMEYLWKTGLCTSVKDNVCKRYKENLIQSCENRNKNKLPRKLASCWLVTDINIFVSIFFLSKSTFLKSQRMSKNLAQLYQSSNTRHIGGKKTYKWFMSALRGTSVRSSTKE